VIEQQSRSNSTVRVNHRDVAPGLTGLRAGYLTKLVLAICAGFVIVDSFAFAASARFGLNLAFGIVFVAVGALWLMIAVMTHAERLGGLRARLTDLPLSALTMMIGVWQIVQDSIYSAGTAKWISFGDACAVLGAALLALILHELSTERVVHTLEVVTEPELEGAGAGQQVEAGQRLANGQRVAV
jgi:predicted anti-sigma-YlaC factor YlaD